MLQIQKLHLQHFATCQMVCPVSFMGSKIYIYIHMYIHMIHIYDIYIYMGRGWGFPGRRRNFQSLSDTYMHILSFLHTDGGVGGC